MKKALLALALLFAMLVAAVVGGWYYLKTKIPENPEALVDRMMDFAGGEETKQRIAQNEAAIADALRAYVKAQAAYKSENGHYARNLAKLDLPDAMK